MTPHERKKRKLDKLESALRKAARALLAFLRCAKATTFDREAGNEIVVQPIHPFRRCVRCGLSDQSAGAYCPACSEHLKQNAAPKV